LYPAQEEAILELLAGNHVILSTPTGSGKSLVGMAGHFAAKARGQRSYYTAPIKALVSEKFFALSRELGSDNVGMVTGDAAVNANAPIICCTQEILANIALRRGAAADIGLVVVDEFHYYADPQRGWAWQVPLLQMPQVQFLLMSATLGPTERFEADLEERTGREAVTVSSTERPVPLDFEWQTSAIHETVETLLETERAPVYVVYFTQKSALEAAQSFTSLSICSKEEKAAIRDEVGNFRFDSPIGKDLKRFLSHGVGIHHAGLLPKYRLLMEKLAQKGLLKVIVGTDTLGVGVNIPIRSVLLTQLFKYDGQKVRILSVREFQQIAGRAGRKGFDDQGTVWVQAAPHVIENLTADRKAAADPKKKKKVQKKKPPDRGYAHWTEDTFTKLVGGSPEPMVSSFNVTHQMLLNLLDRPPISGDFSQPGGCDAVKLLLRDNHETPKAQRAHIRRAISMYRSLLDAEVVEHLAEPDEDGRLVRVTLDLQDDFALNQPLSLFALEVIEGLNREAPDHALDVLSVIEATLENPGAILAAQLDKAKGDLIGELKRSGVEYEERMERLETVEYPKPLRDDLYEAFNGFRSRHPWVGQENVKPKSIVRELYERVMTFGEYVSDYGMKRSEGLVLRYLTDCYRALGQTVPDSEKTEEVVDIIEWLGELVRQVDSSLIDEWERLINPDPDEAAPDSRFTLIETAPRDITKNERAFAVMIRNEAFRWVQLLSRRKVGELSRYSDPDHAADSERPSTPLRPTEQVERMVEAYFEEHSEVRSGPDARSAGFFFLGDAAHHDAAPWDESVDTVAVRQVVRDPEGHDEWGLTGWVDLARSRDLGRAVVVFDQLSRL
jgi:superfamily II RNA helicase